MELKGKELCALLKEKLNATQPEWQNAGRIISVKDGILTIVGLENVSSMEIIKTNNNIRAVVFNLEYEIVKAVLLESSVQQKETTAQVSEGEFIYTTGEILKMPVGNFWGRVVTPLGEEADGKGALIIEEERSIENPPTSIIRRKSVNVPLYTGRISIDSMIPIGRGQRQLILGDRRTGKTSLALSIIMQQKDTHKTNSPVYCIYVSIGKKNSSVARTIKYLEDHGVMEYTTVVHCSASDRAIMKYIAPYAGMTLAEYFRDQKKDVLIVFDDLSQHANAHRELSLLLGRSPGREAYAGDVFYLHSRLLERSSNEMDGGSITALPIVETQGGDISSYIVTNVISITDGQIILDINLFNNGIKPAVNIESSVSRIGSAAQCPQIADVSRGLKSSIAQYQEQKKFSSFISDIDEETINILKRGDFFTKCLCVQPEEKGLSISEQVILLLVEKCNNFFDIPSEKYMRFRKELLEYIRSEHNTIFSSIKKPQEFNISLQNEIKNITEKFIIQFLEGDS